MMMLIFLDKRDWCTAEQTYFCVRFFAAQIATKITLKNAVPFIDASFGKEPFRRLRVASALEPLSPPPKYTTNTTINCEVRV